MPNGGMGHEMSLEQRIGTLQDSIDDLTKSVERLHLDRKNDSRFLQQLHEKTHRTAHNLEALRILYQHLTDQVLASVNKPKVSLPVDEEEDTDPAIPVRVSRTAETLPPSDD